MTNLAAPYRRPVWRELARRHDITIALLESDKSLAGDAKSNRGQDWLHAGDEQLSFQELPTWKYSRGESRYYFLTNIRSAFLVRNHDVVLFGGWESPAYWLLLVACFISGTATVGFYESPQNTMTHKSGPISALRATFFRSMTRVIVPGAAAYDAMHAMGVPGSRILQGFNAVDVTAFHEAAFASTRTETESNEIQHRYLYVGQLIARKRVHDVIQAFAKVARFGDELTVVGTGELLEDLQNLAASHQARITFLGHVPNSELPKIMATHHTLILASAREVWGLVVNEALASGMHVVVAENCGVSRSVRRMSGVYTALENLQDLAEQMHRSRQEWSGRIRSPEILQYSPSQFAAVFEQAFVAARNAPTTVTRKAFARRNR
ncbi:glycosyltransferase family 4 protein [Pseudarthrobacter quantipunctorum]|uniref:Glycosyltransferase family 4 protein n=1 Tax=Pseudarthrobacter quantipunctorum TaxID=3128980 RepID=A0ABZ2R733_9MICC